MAKRKNIFDSSIFEETFMKLCDAEDYEKEFNSKPNNIKCPKYDGVLCKWSGTKKQTFRNHVLKYHKRDLSGSK